jgi:hypothetical protein
MSHLAWNIVTHLLVFVAGVLLSNKVIKGFKKLF